MLIICTALKVGALLISIVLPIAGPRKKLNNNSVEISDWVVNTSGELENISGIRNGQYNI